MGSGRLLDLICDRYRSFVALVSFSFLYDKTDLSCSMENTDFLQLHHLAGEGMILHIPSARAPTVPPSPPCHQEPRPPSFFHSLSPIQFDTFWHWIIGSLRVAKPIVFALREDRGSLNEWSEPPIAKHASRRYRRWCVFLPGFGTSCTALINSMHQKLPEQSILASYRKGKCLRVHEAVESQA